MYTPPHLDDIWLDESKRRAKRLEIAKERARAHDRWKFEAEQAPIPLPTVQPTNAPTPHRPSGPVILDDESLCSSDSSDDDDAPMADPIPTES